VKDEIVDEDSIDEEFEEAEDFVVEDDDDDDPDLLEDEDALDIPLDDELGVDDDVDVVVEDEIIDEPIPARRAKVVEDDDDDEDEADPDDVEEDLDTILKDRIASGDDLDEEDEEDEQKDDRGEVELAEGVTAKREGEFTCMGCFMIVHPRQFGKKDRLTCPIGDEDCPSIAIVAKG
jgi:hypothetical protein